MPQTITIILNWNNAADTLQVANELLKNHDTDIVLVDNASTDQSLQQMESFFKAENLQRSTIDNVKFGEPGNKITLIAMTQNFGFAGAINKIISSLPENNYQYVWLLNNDAIPAEQALFFLEQKMKKDKTLAFAGSIIADFYDRNKVQCCGVRYYPYFGVSKLVLKNELRSDLNSDKINNRRIDFQHGASLLVSMAAMKKIGLMDEKFFLYFEEQDWQIRAEQMGYKNELVEQSVVFHKGSMSTNASKYLFYYYYNTSAMVYSLKHNNWLQKICSGISLVIITITRTKFQSKSFIWGMKGLLEGIKIYNSK